MTVVDEINTKNALRITNAWLSEVKYEAPYFGCGDMEAIKKALEKQIPKKPDIEGDGYADGHLVYDTWICPNCEEHYEIDYDDYDYCPKCGQAIDKSEMGVST